MKGVILAGGLGTRLYPLTHITNKHLLPVYDKPMIYYPIRTLIEAGITEVIVITGGPHCGHFMRVLKNGDEWGMTHLEYAYQEKEGGIADAIALAESFADEGPIAVILGDNTTDAKIGPAVREFKSGAMMFLKKFQTVAEVRRFGVAVFDPEDSKKVLRMEEKPAEPKSLYANTGLYLFDRHCFEYIRTLKPSARGELEIVDLQNIYINKGQMRWAELKGFWSDAGTFDSLFRSSEYWAKKATSHSRE